MAAPPAGIYKMGPITESDTVIEVQVTPICTVKHLVVGDATEILTDESFVPDIRELLPLVKEMPVYEDDVFLIGHAKAGTHWTWEIVSMLMKGTTEYEKMSKARRQLEFHYPDEFVDMPRPRVFNTHYLLHHIPRQAIEKRCKIIVIQRNPKDVAVSLYYHIKGTPYLHKDTTFDEFVSSWLSHDMNTTANWFYYTKKLQEILYEQKEVAVHNIFYEDLQEDPVREVRKLVEYLDIERNDEFIKAVVDKCGFQNLKKADENKVSAIEGLPKEAFSHLYRKGEVGDWKNHLTVARNEQFDKIYNERMQDVKFNFRYTL